MLISYKVFSTEPLNGKQECLLRKAAAKEDFDFWKEPMVGRKADIMASPEKIPMLKKILNKGIIGHKIIIQDVQR